MSFTIGNILKYVMFWFFLVWPFLMAKLLDSPFSHFSLLQYFNSKYRILILVVHSLYVFHFQLLKFLNSLFKMLPIPNSSIIFCSILELDIPIAMNWTEIKTESCHSSLSVQWEYCSGKSTSYLLHCTIRLSNLILMVERTHL